MAVPLVKRRVGKKVGPSLGTESPGRRVPLLASFSHQRVGSSILDFLHEESTTYTVCDEMLRIATSATIART